MRRDKGKYSVKQDLSIRLDNDIWNNQNFISKGWNCIPMLWIDMLNHINYIKSPWPFVLHMYYMCSDICNLAKNKLYVLHYVLGLYMYYMCSTHVKHVWYICNTHVGLKHVLPCMCITYILHVYHICKFLVFCCNTHVGKTYVIHVWHNC